MKRQFPQNRRLGLGKASGAIRNVRLKIQWDLFSARVAVDENMKVINQAINPDLKEQIKYLNKLHSEGLIPPDAFTGAETFESIVTSKTPITGSYIKYFNHDETGEIYQPMPPLTSPQNDTPMWRRQVNGYSRNKFVMFKNNPYPEATIRYMDLLAEPDWSVQAMYGMYGEWMDKEGDQIIQRPFVGNEVYDSVPGNNVPFIITPEVADMITYNGSQQTRAEAIENIYEPYVVPQERYIPSVIWTQEEIDERQSYETEINDYISSTISHWIVDGGIDEEWDNYVKQLETLGLPELTEIYQGAVDRFYE